MSFNNIKTNLRSEKGFTIVELLIVIVVIGILAAITIVSFNGVTNKANATSAKSAASSAVKKAEAYNADVTGYPQLPANLTGAPSTSTYQLTGVTFMAGTSGTKPITAPSKPSEILFFACGASNGSRFQYWDYTSSASDKWTDLFTGGATISNCANTTFVTGPTV